MREALTTRVALPVLAVALLLSATARADRSARTSLDGFLWNTSPVALRTGLVTGGGAQLRRLFGGHGLFFGGQLALGQTEEATTEWTFDDLDTIACLTAGIEHSIGAGTLRATLGLGSLVVRQLGQRAQFQRLEAANVPDLTRDSWSVGPYAALDLGASIAFAGQWTLVVQLGPAFTLQRVSGQQRSRWLLTSGLGVGRGF